METESHEPQSLNLFSIGSPALAERKPLQTPALAEPSKHTKEHIMVVKQQGLKKRKNTDHCRAPNIFTLSPIILCFFCRIPDNGEVYCRNIL